MSKRGVSKISGNPTPKVGEKTTYTITDWYSGTPKEKRNPALVTWELFKKRPNGRFTTTNIKKTGDGSFTFGEVAQKHTYRLEAYLYEAEGRGSSTIEINPQPVEVPKINKVELFYVDDTKGSVFSYMEKLVAKAQCVNLTGQKLTFTLWEDDANGDKHNANNLVIETKQGTVGRNGEASVEFQLTKALMQKAMKGETDQKELEFYVTVEYYRNKKHATNNVDVQNPLAFEIPKDKPKPQPQQQQSKPAAPPKAQGSPAAQKPESEKEKKGIIDKALDLLDELWDNGEAKGTIKPQQNPTPPAAGGKSTTTVEEVKIEALLDAYFAKEEFKKETSEAAGQHKYTFQSNNNNIDKDKVAGIIKGRVDAQVKSDKKYAKLDDIKAALTNTSYKKGESISFTLYKLGPELVKINNAPLEEEVFVVAKTALLDGKEVTIKIKEKDAVLVGKDADLPVLEAKENGNEITALKATAQNGIAKVKIKLRPKSPEDLKTWKEKLKGIKDGTHTYSFGKDGNNTATPQQKKKIAEIIANKIKKEFAEQKKFAKIEDIEKVLTQNVYNKNDQITFDLYKEISEYLWLKAECNGNVKKHEGEFLKKDGAYFMIGKKCDCEARIRAFIRMVRVGEGTGELVKSKNKQKQIVYIPHDFDAGYTTAYGGVKLTDLSTHPQVVYDGGSSAAGAYQVMRYTWWELAGFEVKKKQKTGKYFEERDLLKKYKITDYSAESQDKICIALMKKQRPNLIGKIIANKIEEAIQKEGCFIWASLPETETESHYPMPGDETKKQPATPLKTCIEHYNQFLEEELKGNSKLHLKKGFLKDFDIVCCNESESSGVCPDDGSQCFEYSDVVDSPRLNNQSDNVNKNRWHRTKRYNSSHPDGYYHTGTDILAPSGTIVKSMLCGVVHALVDTFSANEYKANSLGNYIVIKSKDKDGGDVYIKYCHLDEITATKDQKVKHGDPIGKAGSTGNAASVYEKGKLIHGIDPQYRHVHIEAATSASFGSTRIDPEQFMKTKFDETTKGTPQ